MPASSGITATGTSPLITAGTVAPAPLYGTWFIWNFAITWSSSAAMWFGPPKPDEP